jgi:hypothetical protein
LVKPDPAPAKQLLASAAKPLTAPKVDPEKLEAAAAQAKPAQPAGTKPAVMASEEVAIVIPAVLTVDKNPVDNGDRKPKLDPAALSKMLKDGLDG